MGDSDVQASVEVERTATLCDPNVVKQYLLNLVPVLLCGSDPQIDGAEDELEAVKAMFAFPDTSDKCRVFANDPNAPVMYVLKEIEPVDEHTGFSTASFALSFELSWKPTHAGSIALIKRVQTLDPAVSIARQIQVMNLPGPASSSGAAASVAATAADTGALPPSSESALERAGVTAVGGVNPYEALHAYVRFAVSPYFNAYVTAKEQAEEGVAQSGEVYRDDKDLQQQGIPMAKKKLAELELSLLHLQQNMDIPEVVLNIHPMIARAVADCRGQGKRVSSDAIDPSLLSDSSFLNQLQGDVNGWIKEIQKVTKLDRDPSSGTTSQEINFWLSMERALERIEDQLQSDAILLTMDVLKAAKRFHATVSFRTDTGLKEAAERVTRYNVLMKDFPINELLSATEIGRISFSIEQIFAHINKKLKLTAYPIRRALPLVEAVSRDFNSQLVKVLGHVRLMHVDYKDFDRLFRETQGAFEAWESQVKEFSNLARDITRKRSEKFIPIKVHAAHGQLQERFHFVHQFRHQHEQLQHTIVKVMGSSIGGPTIQDVSMGDSTHASDLTAIDEIRMAYDVVKVVDILDVTPEGADQWERAETSYNERVARVENQIIVRLRDRLATARNASEMFRVFSKFNALFVRPKIRGAIQEYQTQLINSVKEDIRRLHDKFKKHYHRSEAYTMSQLRDVSPVSGTIIWVRQIERQLDMYMQRVEDVLGKGWELYAEGQRLQADSTSFRRKLDTRHVYDTWFNEISRRDLTVSGRVFLIARHRATGNAFQLNVSFDRQLVTMFKEVRDLLWLGFQVPHTLVNMARDGKRVYPYAISLMETTSIYHQTSHQLQQHPDVMPLAAGYRRDVMHCISKGMGLKWQYFVTSTGMYTSAGAIDSHDNRNASFVREYAAIVSLFQEKVDALISLNEDINAAVRELATCPYRESTFKAILDRVQTMIDRLNLDNYANLEQWVGDLDKRIEQVLAGRLTHAIHSWVKEFNRAPQVGDDSDGEGIGMGMPDESKIARRLQRSLGVAETSTSKLANGHANGQSDQKQQQGEAEEEVKPKLRTLVHELRIKNQVMYLDPPLENARASWIQQLHTWLAAVCQQRRPQATRYEVVAGGDDDLEYDNLTLEFNPGFKADSGSNVQTSTRSGAGEASSYKDLLSRLGDNVLFEAYRSIESMAKQAESYVQIWLQYQALWDLQTDYVLQFLGDDLTRWQSMLLEIKRARSTFDNSETAKFIGAHCVVDYEQVQSKVNSKYDGWQREILNKFGQRLGQAMRDTCHAISSARHELESHSAESSTTSEVVTFITFVQELKRKSPVWRRDVEEVFRGGQRVLEKQRFQFPNDWMYLDQVDGEWSAFNEILKRKNNVIQEQLPNLQMKIIAEDKAVDARIGSLCSEWEKSKPVQGSLRPDVATNTLNVFHKRTTQLIEEYKQVSRAKEALDMDITRDERLTPVLEEVGDLKSVWTALGSIWREIDELRETPWVSVVVRKVRQQLDRHLTEAKQLPNRMRQYAAYEYMQTTLRGLLKANITIADLKSDALRDRHWRQLFKALKAPSATLSDLTLGDVWNFDIVRNESVIRDVITVAQGEMALEEFLGQIRETWTGYVLELIQYQNKCRLIKGWDELFGKCTEQLSALTAMKGSPYYKVFEEEAGAWEDKLNRIQVLFDVWVDVQRRWVYLEGIFTGSADIKHMLPVESSRFQNINAEFLAVMKNVYKSPFVLDVLNLPSIQRSLERLADLLRKIQKALGEYLERERASFPRFYFVGDEDLLEIIGNSKDVTRIQKHLRKMFAGLAVVQLSDDGSKIVGMASREGEQVAFRQAIELAKFPKINEWLGAVEREMRQTLAALLGTAVERLESVAVDGSSGRPNAAQFRQWIYDMPAQLVVLAKQAVWTRRVEEALAAGGGQRLEHVLAGIEGELEVLADAVLEDLGSLERKKSEHLITELVHQRDVVRALAAQDVADTQNFAWLSQMRFSYQPTSGASGDEALESLVVHMCDAKFRYGFEYLGVQERLVQTPLTDKCYLTLTQALERRLGGSPFGPAGTGKTESVKALATQLGRFALVFCCDENFDFRAMGRIFVGLCQVGAWGVFDEFNRLDERILSAVSQQIQTIQLGLRRALDHQQQAAEIELLDNKVRLHGDTGIFITMNPGYAGRSNLPDNLKKLFRSFAMTKPDRALIAQVMLYSQGFRQAEALANKVVPLFSLCGEQLSQQPHYDFGLRALKSVLVSAGNLKRNSMASGEQQGGSDGTRDVSEHALVIQSIRETLVPKLVAQDIQLLARLLEDVFPGVEYRPASVERLRESVLEVCQARNWVPGAAWLEKVVQLYQMQALHHGLMMVGPSGSGKTAAWQVLLAALERLEGVEGVSYVMDPKAMGKDDLYGTLDATTREWRDGLFTHLLRKIVDNARGESTRRHWIVFDGDVDPEWVENLNSVLDDNRLLTLPNGERLALPPNVRIMFEVETLRYATLATVSRCGMVWFSGDTVTFSMAMQRYLRLLETRPLGAAEDGDDGSHDGQQPQQEETPGMRVQTLAARALAPHFAEDGLVERALAFGESLEHVMEFTRARAATTLSTLLDQAVAAAVAHDAQYSDFPLGADVVDMFVGQRLALALVWAFAGDGGQQAREQMGEFVRGATTAELPALSEGETLLDYDAALRNGAAEWVAWARRVPAVELEAHHVQQTGLVIPTTDTLRHEALLQAWLAARRPLVLCGPPGSGKTMTLLAALRAVADVDVAALNFSAGTTPALVLRALEQHCEYRAVAGGVELAPATAGRWLVVFCDEVNLPAADRYGTQRVVAFLREAVARGGFWQASKQRWVRLRRVQFVGACNPPTDAGRVELSQRFLRQAAVVHVGYPGTASLHQIYGALSRALLKVQPGLGAYGEPLTRAMVDVYAASQARFTTDAQAHYVYSPRELTRWVRGMHAALAPAESVGVEGLVRLWAHEGLRLFQDRLVDASERVWTDARIDAAARAHFPTADVATALARPILYSSWLSRTYVAVERDALREFVAARLRVFCEEELDVRLVLFDDVLEHVLRIDRVLRQPQGHALLIGASGAGKTTLARFAAWMNGLAVVQLRAHRRYTAADFDADLRAVLRRAGCGGERVCFVVDESNVLDAAFLERMNTLLANAEVPGLFDGDELAALLTACREGAARDGLLLDSAEELQRWFATQVARNLHVVFTMNPPSDMNARAATSPALFNRCVVDWFGDWSDQALYQVGREFTQAVDLDDAAWEAPASLPLAFTGLPQPIVHRTAVANALVAAHKAVRSVSVRLAARRGVLAHVTPRHYLDFIAHFARLYWARRGALEEQQRHVNVGLARLADTVAQVEALRGTLSAKRAALAAKTAQADAALQQMVGDQQAAERSQAASLALQAELAEQNAAIAERRAVVVRDLERAEPAVEDAQRAVSGIKKQHLTEVRAMANPPAAVKLALECVCTLLGHVTADWKAIQGVVRRDDFIASIVRFDADRQLPRAQRAHVRRTFLERPEFNFETVSRASKACGPLVKWAIAQVEYADILERVGPLRAEVAALEAQAAASQEQAAQLAQTLGSLEASIARYKTEYAALIGETEALKAEMARVEATVARSVALLESLGAERARWAAGSAAFDAQMATLVGDVLLGAALLAYGGFYAQRERAALARRWLAHMQASGLAVSEAAVAAGTGAGTGSLVALVASADEQLAWGVDADGDTDALALENAAMLAHHNRYPLIIDPTGGAEAAVRRVVGADSTLAVTSFLDPAFLKHVEAALRFGNAVVVGDAEHFDAVLNPLLNRELRRTGGRVLVRLGTQDVDCSPAFRLFLATRDASAVFAPDVASRVTFVNYTVTRASLQAQCLAHVMRCERPDVAERRREQARLQGALRARMHALERELLQALSRSQGSVLDDDAVVATLETLKTEAAEVARKTAETEGVLLEVERVAAAYTPLARASAAVFFALERLAALHGFYQFSLEFFVGSVFARVVEHNANLRGVADERPRLAVLRRDLFALAFRRAAVSLHHARRLALLVQLAQIKLRLDEDEAASAAASAPASQEAWAQLNADLDYALRADWEAEGGLAAAARVRPWCRAWLDAPDAASQLLAAGDDELLAAGGESVDFGVLREPAAALRRLIAARLLQPAHVTAAAARFAVAVFGDDSFDLDADAPLREIATAEVGATTPIVLCSEPGHDAAYRVDALAADVRRGQALAAVALGAAEGEALADAAVAQAAKAGGWVLVKNVHLAPAWLARLEKRLQTLRAHEHFRLFLTAEINPAVPAALLRRARTLVFEPAPGLRANLLAALPPAAPAPVERARLHFLVAWLHAVVIERLRYAPLGWARRYEFGDADLACALATVDAWVDRVAPGAAHVDPARVPWAALRALLADSVYGGRLDNDSDRRVLRSFVDRLFTADAFAADFALVPGAGAGAEPLVAAPADATKPAEFAQWCAALPEREPPAWLGLPGSAETLLLVHAGEQLLADVRRLRALMDDDDDEADDEEGGDDEDRGAMHVCETDDAADSDGALPALPAYMRQAAQQAATFAAQLPASLDELPPLASDEPASPLRRVLARENLEARRLLARVQGDLAHLRAVSTGARLTNELRQLLADFGAGRVPAAWRAYTVRSGVTLARWVADFAARLAHGRELAEHLGDPEFAVWLGGLMFPEAFITATRQAAAQQMGCALEELHVNLALQRPDAAVVQSGVQAFAVRGLTVQGAAWAGGALALGEDAGGDAGEVDKCFLVWGAAESQGTVVPVYLNADRCDLLFDARLPVDAAHGVSDADVVQRAVAVVAA